jgi:hypothetical protein
MAMKFFGAGLQKRPLYQRDTYDKQESDLRNSALSHETIEEGFATKGQDFCGLKHGRV